MARPVPKNRPAAKLVPAEPEAVRAFEDAVRPELVGRNCVLEPYKKIPVPSFEISGAFIAYASPDSTYAVTKRLIDAARKTILIGIYDFTAGYIKELLLKAMRRGVKVSLMLDLDNRSGETELFEELVKHGCEGVPAPSCASEHAHYFASSHEKVIVIDGSWTLVQSGNYTENSIPQNETDGGDPDAFVPGNRDMGVAIHSPPLSAFFTKLLRRDMKLELDATGGEALLSGMAELPEVTVLQAAPARPPARLFPSKEFKPDGTVSVTPVLSPENYMELIPDLLASAEESILIEQQYIRGNQGQVEILLDSIRRARKKHPRVDVRVVIARPFPGRRFAKEAQAIRDLKTFGLRLGENIRILNPKHFVHCHNKLIIVDGRALLLSSQNWSESAVMKNREAGLLIDYPELALYYAEIFEGDWNTALKTVGRATRPELFGPQALGTGKTVPLAWGDYSEV